MPKQNLSRLRKAILEMAAGQHRIGVMDDASYQQILLRCFEEPVANRKMTRAMIARSKENGRREASPIS